MKMLFAFVFALLMGPAFAQESFVVATGDPAGTYSQVFKQLAQRCGVAETGLNLVERNTTGSAQNVELLTGNQVNAAYIQADMLFWTRKNDEAKVANIKTLFGLHPEDLHFVARADTKKEGGYGIGKLKIGGESIEFKSLADLAGRPVGAVGGSVLSGRVVAGFSKLNFTIREYPNNAALTEALLKGEVDAILAVGGTPLSVVSGLDQRYRLLPVSPETQKAVADVYSPTKVSYSNLNQAGVTTVSTQALFATRTYRSSAMNANLARLRACFTAKLGDIQDTRGTHGSWQKIEAGNDGKWPLYALPSK